MAYLAINGGERAVPIGTIGHWPPVEQIDRDMVMASLEGGSHSFGPNCVALEKEFAEWNGNTYAITTNSGTAALHMAVAACGCGSGDEVIVTAYSWSSSATCILHHNALPVFVDIDYRTINMNITKIEAAITPNTKAIIAVHLHGLPLEMGPIMAIASKHNLKVIEDCCQTHGGTYKGVKVGKLGDCAAFSFNQNKCLCSGEGGMFVTDDEDIQQKAQMLWSFGESRSPVERRDYHAYALGWMYRNNDLTAAFGRSQLTRLDKYLQIVKDNAAALTDQIKDIPGLILPYIPVDCTSNYYNYTMRVDSAQYGYADKPIAFRDAVLAALQAEGTGQNIWQSYILPEMTVFQAQNAYGQGCPWKCQNSRPFEYNVEDYPEAQRHCDTHFGMTEALRSPNGTEVAVIVGKAIRKVMENTAELNI